MFGISGMSPEIVASHVHHMKHIHIHATTYKVCDTVALSCICVYITYQACHAWDSRLWAPSFVQGYTQIAWLLPPLSMQIKKSTSLSPQAISGTNPTKLP